MDLDNLPDALDAWLATNGLAMLATVGRDGAPHVTMVGANWSPDEGLLRVISSAGAQKIVNLERDGRCSVSFGEAGMWATFVGTAEVTDDPERVATAVAHYESRFRTASDNPTRVAVEVRPTKVLGRWA